MIQAILFDADGVVINHPYNLSTLLQVDYGVDPTQVQDFFINLFPPCITGDTDLKSIIKPFTITNSAN